METLTLEQASYLAEIIGVLAVVVSLIYVGVQVRQNTEAAKVSAAQEFVQMYNTFTSDLGSTNEMANIWAVGVKEFDSLNEIDKIRFSAVAAQCMRAFESAYYQWRRGALDKELWTGFSRAIMDILNEPGIKRWWSYRKRWHGDEFQAWLEDGLKTSKSNPMYPFHE